MKKLEDKNFKELLKSRTACDFVTRFIGLPSIVGGLLIGNGIVNGNTAMIVAGSITSGITLASGLICGNKVAKIDKIIKKREEEAQHEHDELIWKYENGYYGSDIISEDFIEKE